VDACKLSIHRLLSLSAKESLSYDPFDLNFAEIFSKFEDEREKLLIRYEQQRESVLQLSQP